MGGGLAAVKLDPEHEGFPRADDLRGSLNRDNVHNLHTLHGPQCPSQSLKLVKAPKGDERVG